MDFVRITGALNCGRYVSSMSYLRTRNGCEHCERWERCKRWEYWE